MYQKTIKTTPAKTCLLITTCLLIIYVITGVKECLLVAMLIGVAGSFSNYLVRKIDYLWSKLTFVLSLIIPNILLTLLFFLLLTPIALLSRLFGEKDPLMLKRRQGSMFKDYESEVDKEYFEKTW